MGPRAKAKGIARAREACSDASFSENSDARSDTTETPRDAHVVRALPTPPSEASLKSLDKDDVAAEGRHMEQELELRSPTRRRPTLLRRRTPSTIPSEASLDPPDEDDAEPGAEHEDENVEVEPPSPPRPTLLLHRVPTPKLVSQATPVKAPDEGSARRLKMQRSAPDLAKNKHEDGGHNAQLHMGTDAAEPNLATPSTLSQKPTLVKKKPAQKTTNEQAYDDTTKSWWLKTGSDLLASKIKAILFIISFIFKAAKATTLAGLVLLSFGLLFGSIYFLYCKTTSTGSYAHNFSNLCTLEAHPLVDCHVSPIGLTDGPREVACFLQREEEDEAGRFRDYQGTTNPTFHWTSLYSGIRGRPHNKMPLTLLSLDLGSTVQEITDLIQEKDEQVRQQQPHHYDVVLATIRPDEIFSQLIQFDTILGACDAPPHNQTALRMRIDHILELRKQHLKGLERLGSRLNLRLTRQGSSSTAGGAWPWMNEKRLDSFLREMFLELTFWESNETLVLGDLSESVLSMSNDEKFARELSLAVWHLIWVERRLELLIGDREEEPTALAEVMKVRKNLEDWRAFISPYSTPSISSSVSAGDVGKPTHIGFLHSILHPAQQNSSTTRNEKRLIRTWTGERRSVEEDWSTADLCWNMFNKLEEEIQVVTALHAGQNNSTIQSTDLAVI